VRRRVVITGVGIISCLGNSYREVVESLKAGRSGIRFYPRWAELGLRTTIGGKIEGFEDCLQRAGLTRKHTASMPRATQYCAVAAKDALADAGWEQDRASNDKTGCLVGAGVCCVRTIYENSALLYVGKPRRISPYTIVRSMASSPSAGLANLLHIKGRSYSISAACATSLHNIGHAFELIRAGVLERAVAGGGEDVNEQTTAAFCAMRLALSTHYNDTPERASRPYDKDRDGFVISGGGGIVTLETLEEAQARGAKIYAEIIGYGANSDGHDLIFPEPEGRQVAKCMAAALEDARLKPQDIDYINTHGTSTIAGDLAEVKGIRRVFEEKIPPLSSTKSMGGHPIGAAGAHEVVHCIAMLQHGFIAPSINVENLDPAFEGVPVVTETRPAELNLVMTNSFGFGGTNGVLILRRI